MAQDAVGRGVVEGVQLMAKLMGQLVEMSMNKKRTESLEKENSELKNGMAGKVAEKMGMWKQVGNEFLADNFVGKWDPDPQNPDKQIYNLTKGQDGMPILKADAKDRGMFLKLAREVNSRIAHTADIDDRTRITEKCIEKYTESTLIPRLTQKYIDEGMSEKDAKLAAKAEAKNHPWINKIKQNVIAKVEQQRGEVKFGEEKPDLGVR